MKLSFLTPFYLSTFLQSALHLIPPFYIIYFISIWLDFRQIALISSLRSVVGLFCEIPTGVIADLYGKKFSVILGYVLSAITLFFIPLTDNFVWLSIIFCLNALFETLFTGSDSAWVSDKIEENDVSFMDKYFLRSSNLGSLGTIIAWILWWLTVKYLWMAYLRYICGAGTLIAAFCLWFASDGKKWYEEYGETVRSKAFWQHLKKSFVYLKQYKILWVLFWAILTFLMVDELVGLIWSPYLAELWFAIENLGYLSSFIWGLGIFLLFWIEKLISKKKKPELILGASFGIFALLLFIAWWYSSISFIVLLFVIYSLLSNIIFPIDTMLTNKLVDKNKRATVLSMKSVIENIGFILGAPLMWWLMWYLSFAQWLLFASILIGIIAIMYGFVSKKNPTL